MKKLLFCLILLQGCSNAEQAAWDAKSHSHHLILYSGGVKIGEWDSTGQVENESHSNGYFFQDKKTGKLVCIDGQVIITVNN